MEKIGYMPINKLRKMISSKEISPVEIMNETFERINSLNSRFGAYITLDQAGSLKKAKEAEEAVMKGKDLGPLHGIPIPIKDLEPVKNMRCTFGSIPADIIAKEDAISVERIKSAGGIIIGKTNTPEYGNAGTTENRVFGISRNPWDEELTPGGSSGGSAVSICSGMTSIAQGSDGGGSIRIPASLCGIFGLKPTQGRIPRRVHNNTKWNEINFSTTGPMSIDVTDSAILLEVMSGFHQDGENGTIVEENPTFTNFSDTNLDGIKIAFSKGVGGALADKEVIESIEKTVKKIDSLGFSVEEIDFYPDESEMLFRTWFDFWCSRSYLMTPHLIDDKKNREGLTDYFRTNIQHGKDISGASLFEALNNIGKYRKYTQSIFNNYDLLITPTIAVKPFKINEYPEEINGIKCDSPFWDWTPFTYIFNLTGNPAASIPVARSKDNLPIGMQVVGGLMKENLILAFSKLIESNEPWNSYPEIK
ncbi:MAG: amidase [Dehalococcoidia bacterium]|tara:strand:+ start:4067 stop:5497 length:1431 start_codon:yes stop_codon:yes gene_type:complete